MAAGGGGGAGDAPEEYEPQPGWLAPLPSPQGGVRFVTSVSPDGRFIIFPVEKHVVVRNLKDPSAALVVGGHRAAVTVARFSPDGTKVASGDASGKVRVWQWKSKDHTLIKEGGVLAGSVEDISWSSDGTLLAVAGDGKPNIRVVQSGTLSVVSSMSGSLKKALGVAVRPCESGSDAVVFVSEDFKVGWCEGKPFDLGHWVHEHSNFVNCVRFSRDGSMAVTASSDKRCLLLDSAGKLVGELDKKGMHKGSVYAADFSPDGARVVTSGADKTVRVWSVASKELESTVTLGKTVQDMVSGVAWCAEDFVAAVTLSGTITLLRPGEDAPFDALHGHKARVSALAADGDDGALVTADASGSVCVWEEADGVRRARAVGGKGHSGRVVAVAMRGDRVVTVGLDNHVRVASRAEYSATATRLSAMPIDVAIHPSDASLTVALTAAGIETVRDGAAASLTALESHMGDPKCLSVSPDGTLLAVGAGTSAHLFSLADAASAPAHLSSTPAVRAEVTAVAFAPDASFLVTGDANGGVTVFGLDDPQSPSPLVKDSWNHASRVSKIAVAPSGLIASVGVDQLLAFWDKDRRIGAKAKVPRAHDTPIVSLVWDHAADAVWILSQDGLVRKAALEA